MTSFVFAGSVTACAVGLALVAAGLATQKIRGLGVYRMLLLWPYGIAPAVAGIIFLFIFHPVLRDPAVLPRLRDQPMSSTGC